MIAIRSVLCPVDFSPATIRQLELAIDVCRAFGSRLVLHHNVTDASPGAAVSWMWHADHVPVASTDVDNDVRALMRRVPADLPMETCITRGAVIEAVLSVVEAADADLVVMSDHAGKAEDHASVIEFLLERSRCAVLALHDPDEDTAAPRFGPGDQQAQSLLVPVSLATRSHPQLDHACELARLFPMNLNLLPSWRPAIAAATQTPHEHVSRRWLRPILLPGRPSTSRLAIRQR